MYQISVEMHFEAAHFLRGYRGKCENLHGHRFQVAARLSASSLNRIGLAYDFTDAKRHLGAIVARFDHALLNDIPPFDKINPSSENIAFTIYQELKPLLTEEPVSLAAIDVKEAPEQGVTYIPD
jgi:6-pyruvoyltetrahydropterin/6-carboxytetrahydropterin synthase